MLSQSNGQTVPQFGCSTGKCSDSKFVCCFLGQHQRCEDESGWRTTDDVLEDSEVLISEGTGGAVPFMQLYTRDGVLSSMCISTGSQCSQSVVYCTVCSLQQDFPCCTPGSIYRIGNVATAGRQDFCF